MPSIDLSTSRFAVFRWEPDEALRLVEGDRGQAVADLQSMLVRFGYGIDVSGAYDSRTTTVVMAFQRHFRPTKLDGRADSVTIEILRKLVSAL